MIHGGLIALQQGEAKSALSSEVLPLTLNVSQIFANICECVYTCPQMYIFISLYFSPYHFPPSPLEAFIFRIARPTRVTHKSHADL